MANEIEAFAHNIAALFLTETETAVAILWFCTCVTDELEVAPKRLATLMQDLSLRGEVNVSRLARNLASHKGVVKGRQSATCKIKLTYRTVLSEAYTCHLSAPVVQVDPLVIPKELFTRTRRYLEELVRQVNGTYQYGFFDGCAVLCRRLMETLLIEAFEAQGHGSVIRAGKEYFGLNDIIGAARSGQHIKLSRGTPDVLEQIKLFGDAAAHSRTHITSQRDVDDIKLAFRRIISELAALAKIEPRHR